MAAICFLISAKLITSSPPSVVNKVIDILMADAPIDTIVELFDLYGCAGETRLRYLEKIFFPVSR